MKIERSILHWAIISTPAKLLYLLLNLKEKKWFASSSIALLNCLSSLSKITTYLHHSAAIFDNKMLQNRQLQIVQKFSKIMLLNSKQMSHDSQEAALVSVWLAFFSNMARTKMMLRMGEGRKALQVRPRAEAHAKLEPQVLAETPAAKVEAPPTPSEMEKRIAEVEKLGEVVGLPESSLTQKLAQMAAEARPSMSGGEEPARRKLRLTVGGKTLQKEFLKASEVKKPQRYKLEIVAVHEICQFKKRTDLLILKLPFLHLVNEIALEVGQYDMCFLVHGILTLQEAAEA